MKDWRLRDRLVDDGYLTSNDSVSIRTAAATAAAVGGGGGGGDI